MNGLASAGLITMDEASCIESTDAGRLMSVYYIDLGTMKTIMKIDGTESLERLLWLVCESHELSDMHLRVDERRCLNSLNRNNSAATIRFPMKGKINSRQMKLYCIIQAVLGCLPIPDPSLNQEAMKIMRIADRVCKCLVAYVTSPKLMCSNTKNYSAVLNALVLAKCISAHLWENSPFLSKQLKGIGPTFSSLLATAGKVNFMLLEESHPRDLERIMNKGPPAGNILRKQISLLPKYSLKIKPISEHSIRIELQLLNHAFLSENIEQLTAGDTHKFYLIVGDSENNLLYLSYFKDTDLLNLYDGCITCDVTRKQHNEHKVMAHCISSNFVGIDDHCEYVFNELPTHTSMEKNLMLDEIHVPEKEICVKDRKRKNDTDIVQSKEKIKRDTNIIKQFKHLKESFELSSENLSKNLNETAELSNKILSDLTKTDNDIIETVATLPIKEQITNENVVEISDEEDYIDDAEINNILNEIEGEIKHVAVNNKSMERNIQIKPTEKLYSISNSMINTGINRSSILRPHSICKNKQKAKKSNFSFIDIIEKQNNSPNENIVEKQTDTGFSGAIRDNINEFLKKAQMKKQTNANVIELLSSPVSKNTDSSSPTVVRKNVLNIANENNFNADIITHQDKGSKQNDGPNSLQNISMNTENLPLCKISNTHKINPYSLQTNIENPSIQNNSNFTSNEHKLNYSNVITTIQNNSLVPITTLIQHRDELQSRPCIENNITRDNKMNSDNDQQILELSHAITNAKTYSDIINSNDVIRYKPETNFKTKDNKFEQFIKKFSYKATNINTCTKILPECKIQIISQLKVDFNVTEIKTPNDNFKNTENKSPSLNSNDTKVEITEILSPDQSQENEINYENKQIAHEKTAMPKLEHIENISNDRVEESKTNENVNVNDILFKYKNIIDSRKNNPSPVVKVDENYNGHFDKEYKKPPSKPRKQYKITDLHKVDIPLPESLSSIITDAKKCTNIDIHTKMKEINQSLERNNKEEINQTFETNNKEEITLVQDDPEIPEVICNLIDLNDDLKYTPPTEIDIDTDERDLNLSEAILNPKTFLESVQNETEVIPPPPEFCDDIAYSPIDNNTNCNDIEFNLNSTDEEENMNLFATNNFENDDQDYEVIDTPKVETWNLSTEDTDSVPFKPYRFSNNTRPWSVLTQNSSQRHEKLNRFKFTRHSDFKLKKRV
ncbi:unnamed protein product [Colias eurytheme]|nr:unnamed protein product [Colias eurytheme]